jgi:peptidoglycan/LPS O-acetylase OafA/YrhL
MENNKPVAYNEQIDGLRCIAVLGVLVCHFIKVDNVYFNRFPFGSGVNLFFVISGFLITRILLHSKENIFSERTTVGKALKTFYYRRTLRIFPIYYLLILFLLLINFQNTRQVWTWLVTYTANFYISFDHPYIGSFNHIWSLAVEEQFYLVWPLFLFLVPRKHIYKSVVIIIALSLLFKIWFFLSFGFTTAINALTISCADSLGFGALIAYWSFYKPAVITKINRIRFLVPLSFLPFIFFFIYPRPLEPVALVGNNFLFSIFAFVVVLKASQKDFRSVTRWILENRFVVHLGKISYGIYLYHLFMPDFYNQMTDLFPRIFVPDSPIRVLFLFVTAILAAECSWFVIEKPLLVLKSKLEYTVSEAK